MGRPGDKAIAENTQSKQSQYIEYQTIDHLRQLMHVLMLRTLATLISANSIIILCL